MNLGLKFGLLGAGRRGAGSAFSPSSLSNLVFWHDPSNAASVTLNGSDVSQIADLSGGARHAAQVSGSEQPAYTSAAINGLNAITYTAANLDSLNLASATDIAQNVSGFSFAGAVNIAISSGRRFFTILTNSGGTRVALNSIVTTGRPSVITRRLDADSAVTTTAASAAFLNNTTVFFCFVVDYANGNVLLQVNGTSETQAVVWAGGNGPSSNTTSSAAPNYGRTGASALGGIMGECVGCSRAITAGEIASLRSYFAAKWGTA